MTVLYPIPWVLAESGGMLEFHSEYVGMAEISNSSGIHWLASKVPMHFNWNSSGFQVQSLYNFCNFQLESSICKYWLCLWWHCGCGHSHVVVIALSFGHCGLSSSIVITTIVSPHHLFWSSPHHHCYTVVHVTLLVGREPLHQQKCGSCVLCKKWMMEGCYSPSTVDGNNECIILVPPLFLWDSSPYSGVKFGRKAC